jgi:hypothetical protein
LREGRPRVLYSAKTILLSAALFLAWPSPGEVKEAPRNREQEKLNEPPLLEQKEAEKLIRKVYQDEYAQKTPEKMKALAAKLLKKSNESKDNRAQCYVLLKEARELAAKAGDALAAIEAVEQMAETFQVDRLALRKAAVADSAKAARTPEDARSVTQGYLCLLEDAASESDYEWAKKVLTAASATSKTARDAALSAAIRDLAKDVADALKLSSGAKSAETTLAARPADREANLRAGKFSCVFKNDWMGGLRRIEKGTDSVLAKLALDDLADPVDAASRIALGNAWWAFADKASGPEKLTWRLRGARWLAEALAGVGEVERDELIQRMEKLEPEVPCARLCWHGVEEPPGFVMAKFNGADQRGWVTLEGIWKFSNLIASDAKDSKDMSNRFIRSAHRANWVYVVFEFKGGSPGLFFSPTKDALRGPGTNLDEEGRYNDLKVDIDMGRWNLIKFLRIGDTVRVSLNEQVRQSFSPGGAGYILVKGQRGELRVRRLVGFGYNP